MQSSGCFESDAFDSLDPCSARLNDRFILCDQRWSRFLSDWHNGCLPMLIFLCQPKKAAKSHQTRWLPLLFCMKSQLQKSSAFKKISAFANLADPDRQQRDDDQEDGKIPHVAVTVLDDVRQAAQRDDHRQNDDECRQNAAFFKQRRHLFDNLAVFKTIDEGKRQSDGRRDQT